MKKLKLNKQKKWLLGLCAGLGDYFDLDPNIIRILFLVLLPTGTGIIIYFLISYLIEKNNN